MIFENLSSIYNSLIYPQMRGLIPQCITHDTNEISPMEGMFLDFS